MTSPPTSSALRVLVTGAGGYAGGRLIPRLLEDGHHVVATTSSEGGLDAMPWRDEVEIVVMDVLEADQVTAAVHDCQAVYYLIHGMGNGGDFRDADRRGAQHLGQAAREAGVERIIYLSGIVPEIAREELSEHLLSRLEVEETLAASGVPTITLRAAIIVGGGSTSFEIVRQVSDRLPVQVVPTWMDSRVQPIALVDVVAALAACLDLPAETRSFDIGGDESMTYAELLERHAQVAGQSRTRVKIPGLPSGLVGKLAGQLVDVPASTVEALVDSLHHDMVAHETSFRSDLLPDHEMWGLDDALLRGLQAADADKPWTTWDPLALWPADPDWAGSGSLW